jgi:hypothetical protein
MVAREALAIAHEKPQFIGTVDRQYDESYAKSGAKIGSTLRVRDPNQYVRRQGSRVMNVQDQNETTQNIVLATQDGVDMRFNAAELSLNTDSPKEVAAFSKRYIEPAMSVLISGIEADFLAMATKATAKVAGTPGTPITNLSVPGAARAKLNQSLAPKDNRCVQLDSVTMGGLVNGVAGYFAPATDIADQYREGRIARTGMADWYENERVWTLTNGSDVTISTDAAALAVDGSNVLDFHTLTASQVAIGAVFTVAGIYECHPETKQPYSNLRQFTLVSGGATSGSSTISPAIYMTGAKKNVCTSTGADVTSASFNAQVMTFVGSASTSYVQGLMYAKEAFQFVTTDLEQLERDPEKCVRKVQDGIAMRFWMDSDIRNDELLCRLDILYGFAALRPEWACRLIGA